jgi:transposase-like protein
MPKYKLVPKEVRDEILRRLKEGESAVKLAAEYGISDKTIYHWTVKSTRKINPILELSRLKRENKALYEMIGILTVEHSKEKKEF